MSHGAVWTLIVGMAAFALAFRVSFFLLGERVALPSSVRRALDFVPPAVLAALVLPALVDLRAEWTPESTARIVAGLVAALVAWRTRSILYTLVAGMGALWLALAAL